jgi:hypothetical protein
MTGRPWVTARCLRIQLGRVVAVPLREEAAFYGSMPMWSLTAPRFRCLQPRFRSVVCTDTCPSRN